MKQKEKKDKVWISKDKREEREEREERGWMSREKGEERREKIPQERCIPR